ncbi:hypothetical protein PVAP13_8KG281504 [Panicum virgatum]|uniref:Uncharacterized protein n=1 Tax=Panicum virgatum TaxID=38727 RepID=A0A8T0PKR1_PANVG|nr:hypothetical protein PVAP13_8KG281504 [Panicum virgatum]
MAPMKMKTALVLVLTVMSSTSPNLPSPRHQSRSRGSTAT